MMQHRRNLAADRRPAAIASLQSGLSLVELMVSLVIGLVILGAMVSLFVNTSRNNRELARANSMIENGRLATQLIEADLVHAGFWGGFVPQFDDQTSGVVPGDVPASVPDPCLAYSTGNWNGAYQTALMGIPLQVYDSNATCSAIVPNKQASTDVLVVRHAETCVPGEGGNCPGDVTGALYYQAAMCGTEIGTTNYLLNTTAWTLHRRNCTTLADKRRFISNIYYVRTYSVSATESPPIPTLMRSRFDYDGTANAHQTAEAMVEGIQGFHVELGVDNKSKTGANVDYTAVVNWQDPDTRTTPTNRGDGVPDGAFVSCTTASPCTVAQLMNTTAVKLYVLVRSREATTGYTDAKTYNLGSVTLGPYNDHFKRHLFVTTVRLPNISGRRETP